MTEKGWIKSYRKELDNPIVCKDAEHFAVWNYLLLSATHAPYNTLFGKKKITLKPGQLIVGRKMISEKFKISESKVQRILKTFEIEQQIEQHINRYTGRLITILAWGEYQEGGQLNEQRLNIIRTTSEQRLNTKQEHKNNKNNNIYIEQPENVDNFLKEKPNFLEWAKKNKLRSGETITDHINRWKKEIGVYEKSE